MTPTTDKLAIPEAVELLPCPLCNARAQVEELGDDDSYYVSCTGCGLQQIAKYHQSAAIVAWNRRIPHMPDRGYAEVGVRPLEWEDWHPEAPRTNGQNGNRIAERAKHSFGAYFLEQNQDDDCWWATDGLLGEEIAGPFEESWQAREGAQVYHDNLARALIAPPAPADNGEGVAEPSEADIEAVARELVAHGEFSSLGVGANLHNARKAAFAILALPALAARRVRPSPVDQDARDGVLEEAAKVAEVDFRRDAGQIAAAIRALKTEER